MQSLQTLLDEREVGTKVNFNHLDNRVRCYAHIINICCSHIIASVTSIPKSYLSDLKVPIGSDYASRDDGLDGNDSDEGLDNPKPSHTVDPLRLADSFKSKGDPELTRWFLGIARDPLRRARKLVNFLRSSGQRKEGLRDAINKGNATKWFSGKDEDGNHIEVQVPQLELLKDVKTRWDSVYMMLERLRQLRPVSHLSNLMSKL